MGRFRRRANRMRHCISVYQQIDTSRMPRKRMSHKERMSKSEVGDFARSPLNSPLITPLVRFQRKQYAHIEIVKTEKKGFGLRAASNIGR